MQKKKTPQLGICFYLVVLQVLQGKTDLKKKGKFCVSQKIKVYLTGP